jgi:tetratricopeptide (TPR) repeat protein
MLAGIAVVIALFVTAIFGTLKSSDVYKQALGKATASPNGISELGQPIEAGWLVSGSISVGGSSGEADISIPISGPKNSATIYAVGRKSAGEWKFTRLEVEVKDNPSRIKLLDADLAMAHNDLGSALANQKKYEEAEAEFRLAIKFDSNLAMAHNNLGVTLERLAKYEEAEAEYREAIRIDPNYTLAQTNLKQLLENK